MSSFLSLSQPPFSSQRKYWYCAITLSMNRSIALYYFIIYNAWSKINLLLLTTLTPQLFPERAQCLRSIDQSSFALPNTLRQLCAKWDRSINLWARIATNSASIEAATTCGKCTIAAGSGLGPGGSKRIRLRQRAQDNGRAKIKREKKERKTGKRCAKCSHGQQWAAKQKGQRHSRAGMGKAWQGMWQGEGGRAARHVPSGFAACNPCNKNSSVPLEFVQPSHFPLPSPPVSSLFVSLPLSLLISLSSITQESHLILMQFWLIFNAHNNFNKFFA